MMRSDRSKGRIGMEQYLRQMKLMLENILAADTSVRANAFHDHFSRKDFINPVLSNLVSQLVKREDSCEFLLEIITRSIY